MKSVIFREYDIRGLVPEELNEETVQQLGLALGKYYSEKGAERISLGHDCRLSSDSLSNALSTGLIDSGMDVVDLGMVPTPLVYFSLHNLDVDGGVQITGSHNPPEYNGFKICFEKTSIYGEEIQKIRRIAESGEFRHGKGMQEKADIVTPYLQHL